jgi:hypothetical protein
MASSNPGREYFKIIQIFAGNDDGRKITEINKLNELAGLDANVLTESDKVKMLELVKKTEFIDLVKTDVCSKEDSCKSKVADKISDKTFVMQVANDLKSDFQNSDYDSIIKKLTVMVSDLKNDKPITFPLSGASKSDTGGGASSLVGSLVQNAAASSSLGKVLSNNGTTTSGVLTGALNVAGAAKETIKPIEPSAASTSDEGVEQVTRTEPDPDCKHAEKIVRDAFGNMFLDKGPEYELLVGIVNEKTSAIVEAKTKKIAEDIIKEFPEGNVKLRLQKKFSVKGGKTKRRKTKRRKSTIKRRK